MPTPRVSASCCGFSEGAADDTLRLGAAYHLLRISSCSRAAIAVMTTVAVARPVRSALDSLNGNGL